jgi:hypothetical protein
MVEPCLHFSQKKIHSGLYKLYNIAQQPWPKLKLQFAYFLGFFFTLSFTCCLYHLCYVMKRWFLCSFTAKSSSVLLNYIVLIIPYLGIGIEETNAGIGILASRILVQYRTNKMPDCVSLVRCRTCSGIVSFFSVRYRTDWMPDSPAFRHFYVYVHEHWHGHAALTWTCNMDMDMQYGHAAWTCTRSMALVMQHVSGQWICMDAAMPECR